jgi:hypothetical protein
MSGTSAYRFPGLCAVTIAGRDAGSGSERLSLQGFACRTTAAAGSSFFATVGFRFGVTIARAQQVPFCCSAGGRD